MHSVVFFPKAQVSCDDRQHDVEKLRSFSLLGEEFCSVIVDPDDPLTEKARELCLQGMTAGVAPLHLLKSPQAIFFDMDGTIIEEESLVEIAKLVGKQGDIEHLTNAAMSGGLDFATSLKQRLEILQGVTRAQVESINPTLAAGIEVLAGYCHTVGVPIFLVSGGFYDVVTPLAIELGCLSWRANSFAWNDDDTMAGRLTGSVIDAEGKKLAVQEWCDQYSFDPGKCIAVGDGANDIPMMQLCGLGVGLKPKAAIRPYISICNAVGDHRLLVELISHAALF